MMQPEFHDAGGRGLDDFSFPAMRDPKGLSLQKRKGPDHRGAASLFFSCNEITLEEGYLIAEKKSPRGCRGVLWGGESKRCRSKPLKKITNKPLN
jgi:hypothetical protein